MANKNWNKSSMDKKARDQKNAQEKQDNEDLESGAAITFKALKKGDPKGKRPHWWSSMRVIDDPKDPSKGIANKKGKQDKMKVTPKPRKRPGPVKNQDRM